MTVMKQITFVDAIELMAFQEKPPTVMVARFEEANNFSLSHLRALADDGAMFYLPEDQEEQPEILPELEEPDPEPEEADLEEELEPEEEPEPEKPKRASIDHGKIRALRNAGWSIKQIAEEMKLTAKQVTNSLYRK